MAGKPARDSRKSEKLHFRVTPDLKAKLELEAARNKRHLSAECEDRLWASMEETDARASYETKKLLHAIKLNIFEIEQAMATTVSKGADGKVEEISPASWHKDVAVWTAVREMLFWGPINERRVADKDLMQKLEANSAERKRIRDAKRSIVDILLFSGVATTIAPTRPGIVGLLAAFQPATGPRDDVRAAVEALPNKSEEDRARLLELVDQLVALDAEEQDVDEERAAIVAPIKDAIEKGREAYVRPDIPEPLELALELVMFENFQPVPQPRVRAGMFGSGARPSAGTE